MKAELTLTGFWRQNDSLQVLHFPDSDVAPVGSYRKRGGLGSGAPIQNSLGRAAGRREHIA
jgi:hypothetical protein